MISKVCIMANFYICYCFCVANPDAVTLEDILSFFTGAVRIPVGGFDHEATLSFSPTAYYPSASTCALELILPTNYFNDESLFRERCTFAFKNPCGFGMP